MAIERNSFDRIFGQSAGMGFGPRRHESDGVSLAKPLIMQPQGSQSGIPNGRPSSDFFNDAPSSAPPRSCA
jgi:hypothetical protein